MTTTNAIKTKSGAINQTSKNMRVMVAFLILCGLLLCVTATSFTRTQLAAPDSTAEPKPMQGKVLDQDAASALIEKLKESLASEIDDEDSVDSIVNKWNSRILAGKTRKQAIEILLADVKSVVKEAEITDKLRESWNSDTEETNTDESPEPEKPNPDEPEPVKTVAPRAATSGTTTVGLDDKRKISLATVEMAFFRSGLGNVNFVKETGNYQGQWYEIFKNTHDPNLATKVAAVHRTVKLVIDKGVKIPRGLRVYLTDVYEAQNRAFTRDEKFTPVAYITLGPEALVGGRPDALSATGFLGENKPTITLIHEIGHILHERSLGDPFWAKGSIIDGKPSTARNVTGYAGSSKKEFVAEVFAGLILGKRWPSDVLNEYRSYRGPTVPR